MTRTPQSLSLTALAAIFATCAAIGAAAVIGASCATPEPPKLEAPRALLIGIGCGPDKRVMLAREEDELPVCDQIEAHYTPQ